MKRFLPAILLAIAGGGLATWLIPMETVSVRDHLTGFPDSHAMAHQLRPVVLGAVCFVPALGALFYALAGSLDRYLVRQFLSSFGLCFGGVFAIWLIIDLADKMGDFKEHENGFLLMLRYYGTQLPFIFVELAPFGLLLGLLYCLGKLSAAQEIVGMVQTGRGVFRLTLPLAIVGLLAGVLCLGFNYRWAPWASGFKKAIMQEARNGTATQAENVVYFEKEARRLWLIGAFPYDYNKGRPLKDVTIRSLAADGRPIRSLRATSAVWEQETAHWIFEGVTLTELDAPLTDGTNFPERKNLPNPVIRQDWPETPWKLIKPGLKAENLGIPGLYSWLLINRDEAWANKRRFLTQWHYRWAQPGICLAIVLLAAPLGVVFSRRGKAGGVLLAIGLCAGIMFSSAVFLSLGESGYLPPAWAAWGTNLTAATIALVLIQRRLSGRPIYHTLKKFIPFS